MGDVVKLRKVKVREPRRLTPELVGELLRIHSSCVHSQEHCCPLLISLKADMGIELAANIGNEEDKGFRRTDPMCAARPLVRDTRRRPE